MLPSVITGGLPVVLTLSLTHSAARTRPCQPCLQSARDVDHQGDDEQQREERRDQHQADYQRRNRSQPLQDVSERVSSTPPRRTQPFSQHLSGAMDANGRGGRRGSSSRVGSLAVPAK